ncbi:MAG TPA: 16S rRNA (uracil(1498)-N(3))-methyltransferase [Myxococcales bacterium]|nr:16S rRNA (uracil(1498)-N(3))-methyltransferase [Myxococcales bacterium]
MHRLYAPGAAPGALELSPEQARHLAVLRLQPGASLELFDGKGGRFRAELVASGLRVLEELPRAAERRANVVLAQALAKGEKMDWIVQKATELGVARIFPLTTRHAVVKLEGERGASRAGRWRKIAQEAARQCGRADVPQVDEPRSWEELFSLLRAEPDRRGVLLHTVSNDLRLSAAVRGAPQLLLAVGPEGGFSTDEHERAIREGLLSASLGSLVLRTETAGLAALTVAMHVHGELG